MVNSRLWGRLDRRLPPLLRALPPQSLFIIALLISVNTLAWCAAAVVLHYHHQLVSAAGLSYVLGLRHALDADHISVIDLMTRRLIASGQRPATVGTFFSLGHSTIVIITCIVVAATSGALRNRFDGFQRIGGIIGTSVSATLLVVLCIGNSWVLWRLYKHLKLILAERSDAEDAEAGPDTEAIDEAPARDQNQLGDLNFVGAGLLARIFKTMFKAIDRPWKMYPIGVVFGLGFDTSSEVAILGIASVQGVQGTSIWLILILPVLFTCGMCLLDTTDGALMLALYSSKVFARDMVLVLYYSMVLTAITVVVSAFIGIVQILSLVQNVAEPKGSFWDGVTVIEDHFDIIGGSICAVFALCGIASVLAYQPWRRRLMRRRGREASPMTA